jgi:hypothetical protein
MSGHPARFTQSDLDRIFKAAKKVGVAVRVDIKPDGSITVVTGDAAGKVAPDEFKSPKELKELL